MKLAIAASAIYWLVSSDRLDLASLREVDNYVWLLVASVGILVSVVIPAVRWWILLKSLKLPLGFFQAISLTWFGCAAGLFLPGAVAGDAARLLAVMKIFPHSRANLAIIGAVDRILGLVGLVGTSLMSVVLLANFEIAHRNAIILMLSLVLVALLLPIVVFSSATTLKRLLSVIPDSRRAAVSALLANGGFSIGVMLFGIGLSFVSNVACALALGYCGAAVGLPLGNAESLVYGPIAFLSNCIPISPGGLGIGEAASDHLFGASGIAGGAEAMIVFRVLLAIVVLPGLLELFSRRTVMAKNSAQALT